MPSAKEVRASLKRFHDATGAIASLSSGEYTTSQAELVRDEQRAVLSTLRVSENVTVSDHDDVADIDVETQLYEIATKLLTEDLEQLTDLATDAEHEQTRMLAAVSDLWTASVQQVQETWPTADDIPETCLIPGIYFYTQPDQRSVSEQVFVMKELSREITAGHCDG